MGSALLQMDSQLALGRHSENPSALRKAWESQRENPLLCGAALTFLIAKASLSPSISASVRGADLPWGLTEVRWLFLVSWLLGEESEDRFWLRMWRLAPVHTKWVQRPQWKGKKKKNQIKKPVCISISLIKVFFAGAGWPKVICAIKAFCVCLVGFFLTSLVYGTITYV